MKKILFVISIFLLFAYCVQSAAAAANKKIQSGAIEVIASKGWVIFDPTKEGKDYHYRYGPSIIINPDGSMDAWFASPGGNGKDGINQWDWIRHKRSSDGGKTWGKETVVMKATEGSRDRRSVCDPGVIKMGDWYYLGVTAVEDPKGNCNEIFAARSKIPEGPYKKWNGKGWGGNPQPILSFRSPVDAWGLGEPSFVRKDDTLFVYYTIKSKKPNGEPIDLTLVATAPAADQNWPAKLTSRGVAFGREEGEDSADVKFVDAYNAFVAVSTAKRFTPASRINVRWSRDGIRFSKPTCMKGNIKPRCHNAGISGTPDGHLDLKQQNYIAYAFSDGTRPDPSWGFWYTLIQPITFVKEENISKSL